MAAGSIDTAIVVTYLLGIMAVGILAGYKKNKTIEDTVWVRALVGGSHQDRALAAEVADQRLEPTHSARGAAKGLFLWERAGEMKLSEGAAVIRIHPVGKTHLTADAILLTPDADWKPQDDVNTKRSGQQR